MGAASKAAAATAASSPSPPSSHSERQTNLLIGLAYVSAALYGAAFFLRYAYRIRLLPIDEFGTLIHEFDPYFNLRATEYLYQHGAQKFFTWFDDQVWYPLGRPVGTTIYPGMQFTAVFIKEKIFGDMSINDICCYIPAWFGALQTAAVGLIAYECSLPQNTGLTVFTVLGDVVKGRRTDTPAPPSGWRNLALGVSSPALECGVVAVAIASVIPASLMRSMAGAFDNEAVAVFAMVLTFYFWVRSLRAGDRLAWLFGIPAGLSYFYLVATWGGYIFALNLLGVHAAVLVLMGRFTTQVYLSYCLFYVIGTALAVQVPVVGWSPLKSLEQLGPCGVFLGYQLLQYCEVQRRRQNLTREGAWKLRKRVFLTAAAAGVALVVLIAPSGYFGPLSSRVRGMFVPHTRTGNPLVDSVAEHQATQNKVYFQYLYHLCSLAPIGYSMVMFNLNDAGSFLLLYGASAYFFSAKMNRLVLLTGPIGSILGGIAVGRISRWCVWQILSIFSSGDGEAAAEAGGVKSEAMNGKKAAGKAGGRKKKTRREAATSRTSFSGFVALRDSLKAASVSPEGMMVKQALATAALIFLYILATGLRAHSWIIARSLSQPQIVFKGMKNGETVLVDDYLQGYRWLRDNTPEDSRILSWWDYGYQINGIANRTTLADGNTWNHEHIALLGKILTGNINESYEIARHLADYVLIWAGGGGDDLAKGPHLARIANSVYRDHCPDDPTCHEFRKDENGNPTKMMGESLLYNLHSLNIRPDAQVDNNKFMQVFTTQYGKMRIYKILFADKESKDWVADPANKLCDVPGSWYCPGQYPPALTTVLERKKDFAQLEDFNRGESDEEYQKQYFEKLKNPKKKTDPPSEEQRQQAETTKPVPPPQGQDLIDKFAAPKSSPPSGDDLDAGPTDVPAPKITPPNEQLAAESAEVQPKRKPTQEEIDAVYNNWKDSESATLLWSMISENKMTELENWFKIEPLAPFIRSADGRGAMWWAFENKNQAIVKLLINHGVGHDDKDKYGNTPADLLPKDEGDSEGMKE